MKTDKDMEEILHCALTQKTEPDEELQRKVLGMWKEKNTMKANKKWSVAAVTAMCVLAVGVPVGAAVHYLNAGQVAENLNYGKLAEAFKGKDAIEINETQTVGGYNVTLLGVTSGKDLEKTEWNPDCESDGTYIVVSIEKEDGTPMPGTEDGQLFTVKPFIGGFDPRIVNPLYAEGSFATWTVIDGVQYQLYGVSNLECFADHPLYVCVSDSITYSTEEYYYKDDGTVDGHGVVMDSPDSPYDSEKYMFGETGGVITRNEDYKGVNALFKIQLDASKADRAKAEEYLKQFEEFGESGDTEDSLSYETDGDQPIGAARYDLVEGEREEGEISQEYVDFVKSGEWKEKIKDAELKVGPTEVKRDNKGECPYQLPYEIRTEDGGSSSGILYFYDRDFIDGIAVQTACYGGADTFYEQISVAEKTDDNMVTIKIYTRKLSEKEAKEEGLL